MKSFARTITGILLLSSLTPTVLADEVRIGTDAERAQCAASMGIAHLADVGSYAIRIDACVQQMQQAELTKERTERLQRRAEAVQERIARNSRAMIYRPIAAPETPAERFDRFQQLYNAETTYRKLELNKPSLRENVQMRAVERAAGYTQYVPQTTESIVPKTATSRPSRRLIQDSAYNFTKTTRIQSAEEYRKDYNEALSACSGLTNSFQRDNCVRNYLRMLGDQ